MGNDKELGIYIHIPFCKKKCYYCDFTSFADCDEIQEKYMDCLRRELLYKLGKIDDSYDITTVYIGGGTPSYIDSKYIKDVIGILMNEIGKKQSENHQLNKCEIEITIEINPGTATEKKLQDYMEAGVNRLSLGLQSTNNNLLKEIGRIHNFEQFLETYSLAREVGFKNINIDLMLGLPNQTIVDLKDSLEQVITLEPEHISVYSLILEEDTKLYNMVQEGRAKLPDEDTERQMYWYVKNTLELHGYKHYEISNFSKPGYESRHNVNCWKQKEYLGIGLAASSYLKGERYSNISDLNKYIENVEAGKYDKNCIVEEIQNLEDKQKEFMMLGLRTIDGISIREFKNKFNQNPLYLFRNELDKLSKEKLLTVDEDSIRLTNRGIDLANKVWMEFV
ncbi:MAG: oxygen-independent coproporphyrinogen III oxidase [Clostridia bacterium]|nr:oxygen-independent coproporphyrinogen III oxidase [Clostridia bacterium]